MTDTDQIIQAVRKAGRPVNSADLYAMLPHLNRNSLSSKAGVLSNSGAIHKVVIDGRNHYTAPPTKPGNSPFIVTPPHLWGKPGTLPA